MRLVGDLYCYLWRGWGNNCNTYIIWGEVPIIIDPGHIFNELNTPCLNSLLRGMERDGLNSEEIKFIINTHTHPDHCEANSYFHKNRGSILAFHKDELRILDLIFKAMGKKPEFSPDIFLEEGDLEVGGRRFLIFHTPGHSPGSICIYWPEIKALFTGDLIFAGSVGRVDLPGGDAEKLKASIRRMAELDVELLLPGHMDIIAGSENVRRNFDLIINTIFHWIC